MPRWKGKSNWSSKGPARNIKRRGEKLWTVDLTIAKDSCGGNQRRHLGMSCRKLLINVSFAVFGR
jgi:hypothetical protein